MVFIKKEDVKKLRRFAEEQIEANLEIFNNFESYAKTLDTKLGEKELNIFKDIYFTNEIGIYKIFKKDLEQDKDLKITEKKADSLIRILRRLIQTDIKGKSELEIKNSGFINEISHLIEILTIGSQ